MMTKQTDINKLEESSRLEDIALHSLYGSWVNKAMIEYTYTILKRYLKGKTLELGPAEGVMTEQLIQDTNDLTVVEGAAEFASKLRTRFPKIKVICSLFEDFNTDEKYDTIILGHVLEHVVDPVQILNHLKNMLSKDGIFFAAVPNAHSIHRQAAVLMGLQEKEDSMSALDIHHGHRRVYSINQIKSDFIRAGLSIEECGGYWLKPVSNKQIEDSWTPQMLDAFMKLGEKYPSIAAEIYIVASNNM